MTGRSLYPLMLGCLPENAEKSCPSPAGVGKVLLTQGIVALPAEVVEAITAKVRGFADFSEENDPHGEHDFGSFKEDGVSIFWKIDYYDRAMEWGSPDPADPEVTTRVLTILLAEEY